MHTTQGPKRHTEGLVQPPSSQQIHPPPSSRLGPYPPRKSSAPRPLFAASQHHQVRGFNPSPVEPQPRIDKFTASSEHAFAGRDVRRPTKLPLGVQALRNGHDQKTQYVERRSPGLNSQSPTSAPLVPSQRSPSGKPLRASRSVGENLRRVKHSGPALNQDIPEDGVTAPESAFSRPSTNTAEGYRSSLRSTMTSNHSAWNTSGTNTERSSFATGNSSQSDFVNVYPEWPETDGAEGDIDDVLGMYEDGFESAKHSFEVRSLRSMRSMQIEKEVPEEEEEEERPSSQPAPEPQEPKRPAHSHRRSQSATVLSKWERLPSSNQPQTHSTGLSVDILASQNLRNKELPLPTKPIDEKAVPRDRYGFKKASHHVSVQQYDAWNAQYSKHLERRRKKWAMLMSSYGLPSENPIRFPPKSDKIKRYVRKGVPVHMRGAAWWWYAGGPHQLAQDPELYRRLLDQIENNSALTDNDREHIERDLNRTFPDNISFKPDPPTTLDAQAGAGGGSPNKKKSGKPDPEMPILQALRRVLQAFAVHNPNIGYCQSLNFLAGLLLLFLEEDEVKAFTLLNIITTLHLPGTHGVALEGANIDIAVLMSCVKDTLPLIWARLDDKGGGLSNTPSVQALRLPTVSLATTAWFMSLFVGTLPIESVLRIWDCLFFEGSKTLFRIALAIFKAAEKQILAVTDSMEIFQIVQQTPRSMLDVNGLMEVCFRRRGGFGHVSQELIERRRDERRREVREGVKAVSVEGSMKGSWKTRWRSRTKG
ncbi:Hypothetical protein R9X50_00477200 [Acrodontium crateriforme]|uniref:Rab-GAP TBC domain-containing protein n=1 Tax=Acrodontium crateriforme TaxID=150365 RepID=A0AAQ3RCY2_9PEZI|nr:Hypothetical protein R9X50_00477200 [Acrodontium crateriforme]